MLKSTFLKLYLIAGVVMVGLFALGDATGALAPRFGPQGAFDTSSRQGSWYTYQRSRSSSSYGSGPGRSPGSGGGYGGGGYSGGK